MSKEAQEIYAICRKHVDAMRDDLKAAAVLPGAAKRGRAPKSSLSELKAAAHSHSQIVDKARAEWPSIYPRIRHLIGEDFIVADDQMAPFDLALAATALDLQAAGNLFPVQQAARITEWIESLCNAPGCGDYAVSELRAYSAEFRQELIRAVHPSYLGGLSRRLLHRWLADNVQHFIVEETGQLRIALVISVDLELSAFVGTWRALADQYDLVEEDLPPNPNWEAFGLFDLGNHPPDISRPDGTVIFRDEAGRMREVQIEPRKMMKLFAKHGAEKVGRICRTLVKGPWEGVKETRMTLNDAQTRDFLDKDGVAYAVCAFFKGKPAYSLMRRSSWDDA